MKINWALLTSSNADTGRDPVIGYTLEGQASGDATWTTLYTGDTTVATFSITSGLNINTYYNFRVAATNGVGMGAYSPTL